VVISGRKPVKRLDLIEEKKMKVKESCWNCGKAVKVPADNNNIYTRICAPCKSTLPNETPKFYFTVSKSGKVRDL
jgi:hypothetical protein